MTSAIACDANNRVQAAFGRTERRALNGKTPDFVPKTQREMRQAFFSAGIGGSG